MSCPVFRSFLIAAYILTAFFSVCKVAAVPEKKKAEGEQPGF